MENFKQGCLVRGLLSLGAVITVFLLTAAAARAQQTTGVPCSPSATTTINGKYLPSPPAPFGGAINLSSVDSKPCWPETGVQVPDKRCHLALVLPSVLL